jgi:hypothetical protein
VYALARWELATPHRDRVTHLAGRGYASHIGLPKIRTEGLRARSAYARLMSLMLEMIWNVVGVRVRTSAPAVLACAARAFARKRRVLLEIEAIATSTFALHLFLRHPASFLTGLEPFRALHTAT